MTWATCQEIYSRVDLLGGERGHREEVDRCRLEWTPHGAESAHAGVAKKDAAMLSTTARPTAYPFSAIPAGTLAGLRLASELGIPMIEVGDGTVEITWTSRLCHNTREAVACVALATLDEASALLRFPAADYSLGRLVHEACNFDGRERAAVAALAGITAPNRFGDGSRPAFSAAAERIIERHGLSPLWRRCGRTGTHLDLRPIDLAAYARHLGRTDETRRIAALILLGLYNSTMLEAIAKRRLRIGAVGALGTLRRRDPATWADAMTLLSHYPGW